MFLQLEGPKRQSELEKDAEKVRSSPEEDEIISCLGGIALPNSRVKSKVIFHVANSLGQKSQSKSYFLYFVVTCLSA